MKKKSYLLLISLICILLTGCKIEQGPLKDRGKGLTNSQKVTETKATTDYKTSMEDNIEQVKSEAKNEANSTVELTSGKINDAIKTIDPEIRLFQTAKEYAGQLTVDIEKSSNYDFIGVSEQICQECNMESEYDTISFVYSADSHPAGVLTLTDYKSPYSFSSFFVSFDDYKDVEDSYKKSYLNKEQ